MKQVIFSAGNRNTDDDLCEKLVSFEATAQWTKRAQPVAVVVAFELCPRLSVGAIVNTVDYCLGADSTIDFISAIPLSNWPPIILSMFMNRWMALAMKFLSPDMLHVTIV